MANLTTKYLGLDLKNPIIVGASNLVTDLHNLKKLEEAGASAVVYKSLFEEQIHLENFELDEQLNEYNDRNAEMTSIFPNLEHAGAEYHIMQVKKAKEALNIPLIASLNAVYDVSWADFAKDLEAAGVDALELNFFSQVTDASLNPNHILSMQLEVVREVLSVVNIPVSVKLSSFYTNILQVVKEFADLGVSGFVLFNRFFEPSIDIEKEAHHFPWNLSTSADKGLALRYSGLLYGEMDADVCANTGIHTGSDVIEMLLAGADAVQVVSTLYQNKVSYISTMLKDMEAWMDKKGYADIDAFRGKLSRKNVTDLFTYKRAQYVDILWNSERILNKHKPV
jgi:dihydroorotate dehydrogenase (fumarate)